MKTLLITICLLFTILFGQDTSFTLFVNYFSGNWSSVQEACVGIGKADRNYQMVVDSNYLHITNTAYFQPDSTHKTGSDHHDWGIFSYDNIREKIMLREFNSEGFVIKYALDAVSVDGKTYTFLSQSIENLPEGWQARTTITITGDNGFDELFEVAKPGGEFKTYVKSSWVRR